MPKLDRCLPSSLKDNPRATVAAWNRFQPLVLAAFRQHPKPFIHRPGKLSTQSVISKIRDAIRGAIAFEHPMVEPLTPHLLRVWWEEVIIRAVDGNVVIGPPETSTLSVEVPAAEAPSDLVFDDLDFQALCAFAYLLNAGLLKGPVIIRSKPDTSLLPDYPNLTVFDREDGLYLL